MSNKLTSSPFVLQERDCLLMRGLFESRIMTADHIAALFFENRSEATKKRLQKLKAAGYIGERRERVNEPSILFLTSEAYRLLRDGGHITDYPKLGAATLRRRAEVGEFTIRHELEIMDAKAAFYSAIRKSDLFNIIEFSTWPLLYQFHAPTARGSDILVKPDGFIRIHEKESNGGLSEHSFFLELDRSTELLDTLVARSIGYLNFYRSGGFAVRHGKTRSDYKDFPFRVLIVLKSAERRNNLAERLLQNTPPIFTQVCLTTFEEVKTDPLGSIWITPKDYRNITAGTPFETQQRPTFGYKRQSAREAFVERFIKKFALLF